MRRNLRYREKTKRLWVFGFCARKAERPDRAVDFLVKWIQGEYSWKHELAMVLECEKLLDSRIDLVSSRILPHSPGFANRVCREAVHV